MGKYGKVRWDDELEDEISDRKTKKQIAQERNARRKEKNLQLEDSE